VKPANTNWILVLMRVLVNRDDADVKMVNKLQDQVRVVPLSQYLGKSTGAASLRAAIAAHLAF
jgi:hypothetical protein